MKRLRIIGLALLAMFALGAVAAATASAEEEGFLPLKLPGVQVLAGKATFETTNKESFKCNEVKGTGKFEGTEKDHHGTGNLDFHECETLGFAAFTLGDKETSVVKEALILMPVLFLICLINSSELLFGIFIELSSPVHVEVKAAGALLELTGSFIGHILPKADTTARLLWVVDFTETAGVQAVTECKDSAGNVKKASLKSKTDPKETLSLGVLAEKVLLQFEEPVELMDH